MAVERRIDHMGQVQIGNSVFILTHASYCATKGFDHVQLFLPNSLFIYCSWFLRQPFTTN